MAKQQDIAYSYIRFSKPEQGKGDSLRRQEELRDGWVKRNGCLLDTSLDMQDRGISGFTGAHHHRDNADRYALAMFLELVKEGRVKRGSYLVVENLDRLSREDNVPALHLATGILMAGVRLVQLIPTEHVFDEKANTMEVMLMLLELSRGNSESAVKSDRCGRAWRNKKKQARESGTPMSKRCPPWLRVEDGRFVVEEDVAAKVRMIYRWATDGYGLTQILNRLHAEKISPLGQAPTAPRPANSRGADRRAFRHWSRGYLAKLLSDRRVLGELQLYRGRRKTRATEGKAATSYYPAILSEDAWFAARGAMTARKVKPGRETKGPVNLFKGLLRDARSGCSIHMAARGGRRRYEPYLDAETTKRSPYVSFPVDVFDVAVVDELRELNPADVLAQHDGTADKVIALKGKEIALRASVETLKVKMAESPDVDQLGDVLVEKARKLTKVVEELAAAQQAAACPVTNAWADARALLIADLGDADTRVRLRSTLRRMISEVQCLFVAAGRVRIAALQVHFEGGAHRNYVVMHRPDMANASGRRHGETRWCSFAEAGIPEGVDLRKYRDASRAETLLKAIDWRAFEWKAKTTKRKVG